LGRREVRAGQVVRKEDIGAENTTVALVERQRKIFT
jgi:hypothetical protein